jgi:hypothetical protein
VSRGGGVEGTTRWWGGQGRAPSAAHGGGGDRWPRWRRVTVGRSDKGGHVLERGPDRGNRRGGGATGGARGHSAPV